MSTSASTELLPSYLDVTRLAVASFLARYREPTLTVYTQDLKAFLAWCRQQYDLEVLRVTRGELEIYLRHLEAHGCGHPAEGRLGSQKRTVLHPLELAALLATARTSSANDQALMCLLGMLGLRVSEACAADITDLRYESGYELLHVIGKGAKPADIPLRIPVLRAVREAIDGRATGPIVGSTAAN